MSEERNSNDVEDKISIKEIHETFWRCRDFELSHLWQRSIFLSAFLILCFTGYGSLLITMLEKASLFAYANLLAFSIGVIGIIFSCLWIMMGKLLLLMIIFQKMKRIKLQGAEMNVLFQLLN